jgi:hypothetical protein
MKSKLRKPLPNSSDNNHTIKTNDLTFCISPNPATNYLTIETHEKAIMEILNFEGQIIKTINYDGLTTTIDIKNLSSGIYFIKAKTYKGIAIKKFVKE